MDDLEVQRWLERLESAERYIAHSPFLGVQSIAIGFTAAAWAAKDKFDGQLPAALDQFLTDAENFASDFIGDE